MKYGKLDTKKHQLPLPKIADVHSLLTNGTCVPNRYLQVDGSAVTSLIITRDSFESIDWSSLAYTEGIYDQINDKFDKFYVESTLMKDVNTSKIMYKGN